MPFQRRWKLYIPQAWASLADNMGQGWNPTIQSQTDAPEESDLWTAWQLFPLDDDQTCHSKDGGSAYSDGNLWEEIEWTSDYYITQCTGNSTSLGIRWVGDKMRERKTSTQRGWAPGPRLSHQGERERNADGYKSGVSMLQSCSVSYSLSHTNLSNKVRGIFFKKTVSLVFIVSSLWFRMHMCLYSWSWW